MKRRTLRFYIVNGALLLLSLICFLAWLSLRGRLESQRAAERWGGESELSFVQLSCFMSGDDSLSLSQIYSFRQNLDSSLTTASLAAPENGSLYADAWSSFGKLSVVGDHGRADAKSVAVGGNYFLFHPLRLLSGSYLMEDDVMDDRVLLDRELAWRLFGSDNLAGMTVTIGPNAAPFVVAGVVDRDRDFASRKADDGELTIYFSYSTYTRLLGEETAPAIDCYELVTPQPVEGFAENILKERFPLGNGELVNNTERFSFGGVWDTVKAFGTWSMHRNSVVYPQWENAARCILEWSALFLALALLFAALPAVTAVITALVLLIRAKDALAKCVPSAVSGAVDRSRQKRWNRTHGEAES